MEQQKKLGKIAKVYFGFCGHENEGLGLYIEFSMKSEGVFTSLCFHDGVEYDWSEQEQNVAYLETMQKISTSLHDAKVVKVEELKGKPVELTFENCILKDWRILTEVL